MIKKVHIANFKRFESFTLELQDGCNIIVGDNESGKSTLIEAIHLALTKRINGRQIDSELNSHMFNQTISRAYFTELKADKNPEPPHILIELFLSDDPALESLKGTNNSLKENSIGVRFQILFNEEYAAEYESFAKGASVNSLIPTEYYKVTWLGFDGNPLPLRGLPVATSLIDAASIKLQSGTDYYLQGVISDTLTPKERVQLSIDYRSLKEEFYGKPSIEALNDRLKQDKEISDKEFTVGLDVSQKAGWESGIIPHLDDVPFHFIGKGEQSKLKILLALQRHTTQSRVILIEEPEAHLSYSSLNQLVRKIEDKCAGKQVIISTHNAFVLNKVGLDRLVLLDGQSQVKLSALTQGTEEYFKKLPGYDTLRLILAKQIALVEGPSDELIFQKAFHQRHSMWPHEMGVDVMSVGLSFNRFLEIAKILKKVKVAVATDNDGDHSALDSRYDWIKAYDNIAVCYSSDDNLRTLEPHMVNSNGLAVVNKILETNFVNDKDLIAYMVKNKTECALKFFEYQGSDLTFPDYINAAVEALK